MAETYRTDIIVQNNLLPLNRAVDGEGPGRPVPLHFFSPKVKTHKF